jgi:hypothetical protein
MRARLLSLLALGGALVLGAWLRQQMFVGVVGADNFAYVTIANSILRGSDLYASDSISSFHVGRLTMVLPLAASFALFGIGERAAAVWPALCSLGSVVVVYLLAWRLGGPIAAVLGALFVAVVPVEVLYSTTPLPDTALAFFLAASAWSFLAALDSAGRRAAGLFALSGAALGLAYYARVNALVLLVAFAGWLWWLRRRPTAVLALLPIGFCVVLLAGTAFVVIRGGSPLFELIQMQRLSASNAGMVAERGGLYPLIHFAGVMLLAPMYREATLLFAIALVGLFAARDRRLGVPAIWLVTMYLYLEVFSQYPAVSLVQKEPRYLTPLAAPMAVVIGIAGSRALAAVRGRLWQTVSALGGLAIAALMLYPAVGEGKRFVADQRSREAWGPREASAVIQGLPDAPVYVTADWLPHMNFFGRYRYGLDPADPTTLERSRLKLAKLDPQSRPVGVGPGYVVHDEKFGLGVPPDWRLVSRVPPGVSIYYAPAPRPDLPPEVEMRLGLAVDVSPALRVVSAGTGKSDDGGSWVALDWEVLGPVPIGDVEIVAGASGRAPIALRAPLAGSGSVPPALWQVGSLYREYYRLPPTAPPIEALTATVRFGDGSAREIGAVGAPRIAGRTEPELFAGVAPDQDRSLLYLTGWGSYSQPPYSGGKAAIARLAGARMAGQVGQLPAGDRVLWLRVFSYGPNANQLSLALNGQTQTAQWRSGAQGLGWLRVAFPGNAGGGALELTTLQIGQPFAIVDLVAVEP